MGLGVELMPKLGPKRVNVTVFDSLSDLVQYLLIVAGEFGLWKLGHATQRRGPSGQGLVPRQILLRQVKGLRALVGERRPSHSDQALMMLLDGSSLWGRVAVGSFGWSSLLC